MKTFSKTGILLVIVLGIFGISCQSQTSGKGPNSQSKVQNLETFARLYGYARWFHPSDEAQEIDWDKFAVLGVQKVENVKSSAELRDTLYKLFSPIVQGLQIYEIDKPEIFNPDILLSPDPNAKLVAWQHYGVYLNDQSNLYKSIRTNTSINKTINSTTVEKQLSNPSHLYGKEVKFSGYFRSEKGSAKLFIQPFISINHYNKHEILIESPDWKRYELTQIIPEGTIGITYGFEIEGDCYAEILADDFEFIVNKDGEWLPADTVNMGFECGKIQDEEKLVEHWKKSMIHHVAEITDKDSHSGKYSIKVYYTGKMFERMPQFGEITKAAIGNNLICVVPLTLQTNDSVTYPKTDISKLAQLQSEVADMSVYRYSFNEHINVASIIIAWNVLQHFFPYFDVIDTDWNRVLTETLESTFTNRQKKDFFITLSEMFAKIHDGHGIVFGQPMSYLPVRTEFIENKIVITASNDTSLKRGDIIHRIDGQPVMEALAIKEKIISGSPQLRRRRALNILGSKLDPDNEIDKYLFQFADNNLESENDQCETHLVIEQDGKEKSVIVANGRYGNMFFNPIEERPYLSESIVELEPGIYYINMANCKTNEFEQKKEILANAKAVIYDQRGGNKLKFFQIVPYLIKKPVTSTWWNIPQTIYPDRKDVEFHKYNWDIQPRQPLFKSKSIIINDPSVVSAGETMMSIINHYNLATTVGETTAGCNGSMNTLNMPYGYYVWFTGMKVLKHDGSQLYLKGFEPDYPVNKTIQAVKEGRDEYLEKALDVARQQ